MKRRLPRRLGLVLAAAPLAVVLVGVLPKLDPRRSVITVNNRTSGPLRRVWVDDRWFRGRIARLEPGESGEVHSALDPTLHFEVRFLDARGKVARADSQNAFHPSIPPESIAKAHVMVYDGYVSIVFETGPAPPSWLSWRALRRYWPW